MPDGRVLRTKVSRSIAIAIGDNLLHHIVRDQLETTIEAFRAGASGVVETDSPSAVPDTQSIPGWLVVRLIHTVGLDEAAIRVMLAEGAAAAWEAYTRKESR